MQFKFSVPLVSTVQDASEKTKAVPIAGRLFFHSDMYIVGNGRFSVGVSHEILVGTNDFTPQNKGTAELKGDMLTKRLHLSKVGAVTEHANTRRLGGAGTCIRLIFFARFPYAFVLNVANDGLLLDSNICCIHNREIPGEGFVTRPSTARRRGPAWTSSTKRQRRDCSQKGKRTL